MNLGPLAAWAATALGTGTATALVSGWLNRRKTEAETARTGAETTKVEAEARKIEAEADAARTTDAEHVIAILRYQLDRQQADVDRLREELAAVRHATEECEAHRATDRAELAAVKAANAGLTRRLDELTRNLHRTTTGDHL